MGISDRIRWSKDRLLSKVREFSKDTSDSTGDVSHYTLDHISSVNEEPVPILEGTAPPQEMTQTSESTPVAEVVTTDTAPKPVPIPLMRRANRFSRSLGASSRKIAIDETPVGLTFVGFVALVFASLYLMKLFTSLDAMQEDMSLFKRIFSAGMLLFLFYQYIGYVITIFQLKSGMRGSWAAMVRSSGSYILLMILAETGLFDWLPFDLVAFPSWILMLFMACVMLYMLLPFVREYYKPKYAEMVPLTSWLLFLFWVDPYDDMPDFGWDMDIPSGP